MAYMPSCSFRACYTAANYRSWVCFRHAASHFNYTGGFLNSVLTVPGSSCTCACALTCCAVVMRCVGADQ